MEKERHIAFTPSRRMNGRLVSCYDDRFILKYATDVDGIVVSNDNYRDLTTENPEFKKVVEERLLMYTFAQDRFMPPEDPLGRKGPSLDNFLRRKKATDATQPPCPYGKKCTYGNKCKYYHPERGNQPHKSVTERLFEQAKVQLQEVKARNSTIGSRESSPAEKLKATASLPPNLAHGELKRAIKKNPLSRTKSVTPGHVAEQPPHDHFWAAMHQQQHGQPLFSSSSCAELYPDRTTPGGEHMFVAKRLSDPENAEKVMPQLRKDSGANLHRKLARQLTLNPTYDPRLHHLMSGYQQQGGRPDPTVFPQPVGAHRQLNRLSSEPQIPVSHSSPSSGASSSCGGQLAGHTQFLSPFVAQQQPFGHPNVTRISSAPDAHSSWLSQPPQLAQVARLNSSSDTRLHQTPSPPPYHQVMAEAASPIGPFQSSIWGSGGSLGGSQLQYSGPSTPNSWASSPPQHSPLPAASGASSVPLDEREKLYYHLSSLFPEEQVKAAMDMYPDEIRAAKICAAILNMFPKGSP